MHNSVSRGIDRLLRLDFPSDMSELGIKRHEGRTVNALEMIDALEVLRQCLKDTSGMVGQGMYRGEKVFDFVHDTKEAIRGYFLVGEDTKASALRRRKYNSMVVLALDPIVNSFNHNTHEEMLELHDEVVDEAIDYIINHEKDATADDAFVVQHLIKKEIQRRNRVATAVDGIMRLRRRKKKRGKKKAA